MVFLASLLYNLTSLGLSARDVERAEQPRPSVESAVHGATPAHAFQGMNRWLEASFPSTRSCAGFTHEELNELFTAVYSLRDEGLDTLYAKRSDRRALHFGSIDYKLQLWAAEEAAALIMPSYQQGAAYDAIRDGKCAEISMMVVHHLTESTRAGLDMELPLMPDDVAPQSARSHEYDRQIGCTSCHVAVHVPGEPPVTPIPFKNSTAPQYPTECPLDDKTGLPTVWYDRRKRCDWDYEPFCEPCEGRGGMIWGPNEHDWLPMPCEPIAKPSEIPTDNLTKPLWPRHFTVEEHAASTFPGADPCSIDFKNSTYTLYFDTSDAGDPTYHTVGHTGPSGPLPFPGKAWALSNGNLYTTVDVAGHSLFCACVSPRDPVVDHAVTGPLTFDFDVGAKLVGREKIRPEYFTEDVIADHWVKGPHHFWYDVKTNLMLREWQPFNALQTYKNWNLTRPNVEVDKICTEGFLRLNVSCIAT